MSDLVYRRLRAPTEDGAALIDPPLGDLHAALLLNQFLIHGSASASSVQILTPMLLRAARAHLVSKALEYTSRYRDTSFTPAVNSTTPLILLGHQPDLFHPGVWFKNYLASSIARPTKGVAISLIVDNDVVHNTAIRVPSRSASAGFEAVPFDAPGEKIPFEQRRVEDLAWFASFGERVQATAGNSASLVTPLWRFMHRALRRTDGPPKLGQCLAEARHSLEGELGLRTLELPLHAICQSVEFRGFVLQLLQELPLLHEIYNRSLAEYRAVNHIRSHAHPVPDLAHEGEWLEAPLWIWSAANPHRRRVFVRQRDGALEITDRGDSKFRVSTRPTATAQVGVEEMGAAESRGIKLRPRAIITTMYARLVLSDLFIHGIGGAKYDELTDAIIRRFFGIEPPAYVTATATFRLPIDRPQVTLEDVRELAQRIRDVRYRPESLLKDTRVKSDAALREQLAAYAAEKREYLAQHDLRRCSHDVFDRLDALNRAMHELLQSIERELRAEQVELAAQLKQAQLLASREFSFVLFPSEILPARLLDLCKVSS